MLYFENTFNKQGNSEKHDRNYFTTLPLKILCNKQIQEKHFSLSLKQGLQHSSLVGFLQHVFC
jgi:hypothetical protein